jgi:hypothetical protein
MKYRIDHRVPPYQDTYYDPRWVDFKAFYDDLGPRPEGMQMDRIDPNGHYTKANIRWADRETQANNKKKSQRITIEVERGRSLTIPEWAREIIKLTGDKGWNAASLKSFLKRMSIGQIIRGLYQSGLTLQQIAIRAEVYNMLNPSQEISLTRPAPPK